MTAATAARTASIIHLGYSGPPGPSVDLIERYMRLRARPMVQLSDSKLEASVFVPSPVKPEWLENTQRAIRESVVPDSQEPIDDGHWLSQSIVNAATDFFQNTADLLPGEPFIYSSREGDLVGEFEAKHGTMTSVISSTFILLFAVIDGVPIERRIVDSRTMREEVQRLTGWLLSGHDGNLEAAK